MKHKVTNKALWQNLSEIDKKLDVNLITQKAIREKQEETEIKPDFSELKNEINASFEAIRNRDLYFNFYLFKIRKTSVLIAFLTVLILILTLFCMKQQNDYGKLWSEF